jgi:ketosteroid isomerase-like protein
MNTTQIASRLVEFCRRGDYASAQRELYADDAVSIEPDSTPETIARGREALANKTLMFHETFEVHGGTVSDPIVAGDFFACVMTADVTERKSKQRMTLVELCLYEVKNAKIVREQFFFRTGS